MSKVKIGIVGAGSAGLFAANEIGKASLNDIEITVFDAGPEIEKRICPQRGEYKCAKCNPCRIMSGVGGAGAFSSGILNLNKEIGGDLDALCAKAFLSADEIIRNIDAFFVQNGAPDKVFDPYQNIEKLKELKLKCAAADIKFIPIKQRLLGSQKTPEVIKSIQQFLESNFDVKIVPNKKVHSFDKSKTLYF